MKQFARLLQISPKALRQRAARGQVPRPFKLGKALAWTRDSVLTWLRDCGRSAGPTTMKISLRPYSNDKSRWHVDIRLMNPCDIEREIRKRLVAPAGLSKAQARAWGERQVPKMLREVMGDEAVDAAQSKEARAEKKQNRTTTRATPERRSSRRLRLVEAPRPRSSMTMAEFFAQRFEPEHLRLQKPATRDSYECSFRVHIGPGLGALPLAAIDEDRLSAFRAGLRERLGVRTVNLVLAHLTKMLRFAKKLRLIERMPDVEKLPSPRRRPKEVYSDEEIERLLEAAAAIDPSWELICLLALDAGLRVSEICALEWGDVDLDAGLLTVQHNVYRGRKQTPKGTIGRVALSSALRRALAEHRRREPIGPLVLYRRNYKTGHEWRAYSRCAIRRRLHQIQEEAGLRKSGPHLLRHTALTRLTNLGASVYVVQAVARHSDLQTTQAYIHSQQAGRTLEAAQLLDQAALAKVRGKELAKPSKGGDEPS
ncbi:MAG: site-specific integrase [Nannocystaceae bacterium]